MKIIEGLILKDLLQLKSYVRTMFFYIVIFFITSFSYASEDKSINPTLLILITLAFGMFAIVSFSYDTTSKADRYVLTLPTTKKRNCGIEVLAYNIGNFCWNAYWYNYKFNRILHFK